MLKQTNLAIQEVPWRIWLMYKKQRKIQNQTRVRLELTTKGVTVRSNYDQDIQKTIFYLSSQGKRKGHKIIATEQLRNKLEELDMDCQFVSLNTLRKVASDLCQEELIIEDQGLYFLVFDNVHTAQVEQIVLEHYSEALVLTQSELVTLICIKAFESAKPKYDCIVNMLDDGVILVKGSQKNVSKYLETLKQLKQNYRYKVGLSQKENSLNTESIRLLTHYISEQKNMVDVSKQKFEKRISQYQSRTPKDILNNLIKNYENFHLVAYSLKQSDLLSDILQRVKDQYNAMTQDCADDSVFVSEPGRKGPTLYSDPNRRRNKSRTPPKRQRSPDKYQRREDEYSSIIYRKKYYEDQNENVPKKKYYDHYEEKINHIKKKKENTSQSTKQKQSQTYYRKQIQQRRYDHYEIYRGTRSQRESKRNKKIPIHPLVYQGFKKFVNFKSKIEDLKNSYKVLFRFPLIGNQAYIQFSANEHSLKVYQDLNFFFQRLQIQTYRIITNNNYFKYDDLSDDIQSLFENDYRFKNIVASRVWLDGYYYKIQIFYSRDKASKDFDDFVNQLKLLLRDTSAHLFLLPRDTIRINIHKYFQYT